ncbi:MAG: hypothetical protein ACLUUO_05470 [Sellimonas intestinalis]
MTLDYSDLLSPRPLHFEGIGSIKSPTINEVWDITYYTYAIYVNHVSMSPENYYKTYIKTGSKFLQENIEHDEV